MSRGWARAAAAGLVAALGALALLRASALPEPLLQAPLATLLLDRGGALLEARVAADGQWRLPAPQGEPVPAKFARALILAEDRRFHAHPGVDPLALARAARTNWRRGRVVSGGSTLSMQLVRLARGNPPRRWREKASEALAALRLELRLEKAQILGLYAAHAPFGGNVVGLEAAAWRYFGRPAGALSWAESALLAVLPRDPSRLLPGGPATARLRALRDGLLERLCERGDLDGAELAAALREPLPGGALPLPSAAPHLLETLRLRAPGGRGGAIATTLDAALQRRVSARAAEHARELARRRVHNLAALVIENRSGEVLAYLGNAPQAGAEHGGAVDIVQRPRSTGSVLKPFLYAALFQEGGLLPGALVPDVPSLYAGYRPQNFDQLYRGAVPAREALASSLNVPAVRLLQRYGVARFHALLRQRGMTTLAASPSRYGLTLVLGGAEGTLWEIAGLYADLARLAGGAQAPSGAGAPRASGGAAPPSGLGLRVERVAPGAQPAPVAAAPAVAAGHGGGLGGIGPGAAWLALQALIGGEHPEQRQSWRRFSSEQPIAWKTGTSWGQRDAWAIGASAQYTVAVWVGNASGEGIAGLTGIDTAAPLLFGLFELLGPARPVPMPLRDLRPLEVCAADGFAASAGCATRTEWVPRASVAAAHSPYQRLVHLDPSGAWRVHAGCERLDRMRAQTWFVLPPAQEFYYRLRHAEYRSLPPLRPDCRESDGGAAASPLELLYPAPGGRLYIPVELGGQPSRAVLEAVHRRPGATIYWHLDDDYLGESRDFHRWPLLAAPGIHRLTLVDDRGARLERQFEVLPRPRP